MQRVLFVIQYHVFHYCLSYLCQRGCSCGACSNMHLSPAGVEATAILSHHHPGSATLPPPAPAAAAVMQSNCHSARI